MSTPIKINDTFTIKRDQHCWSLETSREGMSKATATKPSEPIVTTTTTYYANLEQTLNAVLDRACGDCESIKEVKDLLVNIKTDLLKGIKL